MHRSILILIIAVIMTIGCDSLSPSSSYEIITLNGKKGAATRCYWQKMDCYRDVSKICPNGYIILSEAIRDMLVECK